MTPLTRLGIRITTQDYARWGSAPFEHASQVSAVAQASGFDSVWVSGATSARTGVAPGDDVGARAPSVPFEAYTLLGGLSARTTTVRLGVLVSDVDERAPALLAKLATALDVLSGGRAVLGIGIDALHCDGAPTDGGGQERLERLEEALLVCRAMFTQPSPTFEGRHYRIDGAVNHPPPLRPGGPPVLVDPRGDDRALGLVARHAEGAVVSGDPEAIRRQVGALRRRCEEAGRDPAEVAAIAVGVLVIAPDAAAAARERRQLHGDGVFDEGPGQAVVVAGGPDAVVAHVGELFGAGVDGVVLRVPGAGDLERVALAGATLGPVFGDRSPGG